MFVNHIFRIAVFYENCLNGGVDYQLWVLIVFEIDLPSSAKHHPFQWAKENAWENTKLEEDWYDPPPWNDPNGWNRLLGIVLKKRGSNGLEELHP